MKTYLLLHYARLYAPQLSFSCHPSSVELSSLAYDFPLAVHPVYASDIQRQGYRRRRNSTISICDIGHRDLPHSTRRSIATNDHGHVRDLGAANGRGAASFFFFFFFCLFILAFSLSRLWRHTLPKFPSAVRARRLVASSPFALRPGLSQEDMMRTKEMTKEKVTKGKTKEIA